MRLAIPAMTGHASEASIPRRGDSIARVVLAATALALTACAAPPAPSPEVVALEQRLSQLEGRVELLERYVTAVPAPPLRSRDEIEQHIRSLEARRATLLQRYTPAHPEVRDVDLQLRLLRLQLAVLDQAAGGR